MPFDVKKEFKDLYAPKPGPRLVTVPPARFIAVRGQGDPNDPMGEYARAVPMLYALIYTIKMSKKGSRVIDGFEDFVVPPLEGLWWMPGIALNACVSSVAPALNAADASASVAFV